MKLQEPQEEKRQGRRFSLHAPVLFTVRTGSGVSATRSGVTRDVGPGGLFFQTDAARDIEANGTVNVRLLIPRDEQPSALAPVALSAEARVVRTEPIQNADHGKRNDDESSDFWGVAVQFIGRPTVDLATAVFGNGAATS